MLESLGGTPTCQLQMGMVIESDADLFDLKLEEV